MASLTDVEMTADEIERAIAHFTSLRVADEPTEADPADVEPTASPFSERDALLRDRLAQRLQASA
jgi:hypothetical protein